MWPPLYTICVYTHCDSVSARDSVYITYTSSLELVVVHIRFTDRQGRETNPYIHRSRKRIKALIDRERKRVKKKKGERERETHKETSKKEMKTSKGRIADKETKS